MVINRQHGNDENAGAVHFDRAPESDLMLLACSGFRSGEPGWSPYAFLQCTDDLPVNRLYVRDLYQAWYHMGLKGVSENIDETADFLRRIIKDTSIQKTVIIGVSSGGYLALLLGPMLVV
jgi:pimeloyl-ACP methyl ester carboxylesterase